MPANLTCMPSCSAHGCCSCTRWNCCTTGLKASKALPVREPLSAGEQAYWEHTDELIMRVLHRWADSRAGAGMQVCVLVFVPSMSMHLCCGPPWKIQDAGSQWTLPCLLSLK
jgi:hypothetical protein